MKVTYFKWHNNYDLVIGDTYQATRYKPGWLLIEGVLYREECFIEAEV